MITKVALRHLVHVVVCYLKHNQFESDAVVSCHPHKPRVLSPLRSLPPSLVDLAVSVLCCLQVAESLLIYITLLKCERILLLISNHTKWLYDVPSSPAPAFIIYHRKLEKQIKETLQFSLRTLCRQLCTVTFAYRFLHHRHNA